MGAKLYMQKIKDLESLGEWWEKETASRKKFALSPTAGPGAELKSAYMDRAAALREAQDGRGAE